MTNTVLARELQARGYSATLHHLSLADQVVGHKFRLLPPWSSRYVTRVIRKDARGFYAVISGVRCECVPVMDFHKEKVIGFVIPRQ